MAQIEYIDLTFSDRKTWRIPAYQVAAARAHYYAEGDVRRGDSDAYEKVFASELKFALGDEGELRDWLSNNMDWADFADTAVLVSLPEFFPDDYATEFTNAHQDIVWKSE